MAEKILKSPGVSAREIDLSQPGQVAIQGTPAVIIGTSQKGPAFVPVTFANMADFNSKFGVSDGEKFGPLAVAEWMRNARSGAYVRVLGVGKGEKALSTGVVENAGFVVGARQVQDTGLIAHNKYGTAGGPLGRTMFLSAIMAETTSKYFTDAGISSPMSASIIRGVMMFPSGESKTNGTCMLIIFGPSLTNSPFESNFRDMGLEPISTTVLINSRPWIPSLLGRTISDISVNMPSQPGPPKRPRYPWPCVVA